MKKSIVLLLVFSLVFCVMAQPVLAEEVNIDATQEKPCNQEDSGEIEPYLYQNSYYSLNTKSYTFVTKFTPFFMVELWMVNSGGNGNAVTFQVRDQNGIVKYTGACNPGGNVMVSLPGFPLGNNSYWIYAKSNWSDEVCQLTVSDNWG